MIFSARTAHRLLAAAAVIGFAGLAQAQTGPARPAPSSAAERVYELARPKLLQIRTLVSQAGRQSSLGSGFLVADGGLAVTNYHVVSQYALDPRTYRMEYTAADGSKGELQLLALDIANDLAVVRLDTKGKPAFEFDPRAMDGTLPKGERLYSMGNPLDLGFTIVEGTYNGMVERSYSDRVHFSGALNPGMSGGPAVAGEGRIVGVNVSKRFGGEQVSFLVPARFASALVARAADAAPLSPADVRAEIGRQLARRQSALVEAMGDSGFKMADAGPYRAPEAAAPWFTCWARTNEVEIPPPRARQSTTNCTSDTQLFVANDLLTGAIQLSHSYLKSATLNDFQFAAYLSQRSAAALSGGWSKKWFTQQRCHSDFVNAAATDGQRPRLLTKWCARAYREFEGLYDIGVTVVTQDSASEALVSQMNVQAVGYDSAIALSRRFIEAVQWAR